MVWKKRISNFPFLNPRSRLSFKARPHYIPFYTIIWTSWTSKRRHSSTFNIINHTLRGGRLLPSIAFLVRLTIVFTWRQMLYRASWFHSWYKSFSSSSSSLDLRTMKGEDRWQPVYIHRMEKKLPGTAQMHKYIEENAHVPRTMGQSRAEGDPPLDTSASHFFFDNGRKKASHVYLDEVRQSRWLKRAVVVQTDVSQTKWIEEGWFRFDSKREWELYGSSLRKREYLLFFYYRLDFLC